MFRSDLSLHDRQIFNFCSHLALLYLNPHGWLLQICASEATGILSLSIFNASRCFKFCFELRCSELSTYCSVIQTIFLQLFKIMAYTKSRMEHVKYSEHLVKNWRKNNKKNCHNLNIYFQYSKEYLYYTLLLIYITDKVKVVPILEIALGTEIKSRPSLF